MQSRRIKSEQIPNCYFLGGKLAKLRIYQNKKISPDPTGRKKYLASPKGWKLIEEHLCPIENGVLQVPSVELETAVDVNGIPNILYDMMIVDEKGAERCSLLALHALMSGTEKVIEAFDEVGNKKPVSLVIVSIEKTNEFVPFLRVDGKTRYKPKSGVPLKSVKTIQCIKQGDSLSLPPNLLSNETDSNGNSSVIYIFLEKLQNGKSAYLATMHFEKNESSPTNIHAILYKDLGPQSQSLETDPIPNSGYLGKSAILRIYRNRKFSPNPTDKNKYIGESDGYEFVEDIHCSIKEDTLYVPNFTLEAETNAEGKPTVIYTAVFVDEIGVERDVFFSDLACKIISSNDLPSTLKLEFIPTVKYNPLKVYRSRDFIYYLNENNKRAYEPKPESLEYVMDISYEIKDSSMMIYQWTIDIDESDINQNEDDTPVVIYKGIIIDRGIERIAFVGYLVENPLRLITYESEQSKVIVNLFKPSPFRRRKN